MPRPAQRDHDRPAKCDRAGREPAPVARELPVLALQRTAGNTAVTSLLSRESLRMRKPNLKPTDAGHDAATQAVGDWFAGVAAEVRGREGGSPIQSVAELVYMACELTFTDDRGRTGKVRDHYTPSAIERFLRDSAKYQGIQLLEHRAMTDVRGVGLEASAILANLGRVPTEVTFGGGEDHITISLAGKVTAQLGGLKVEGSAGEVSGKASVTGRVGEVEAHGSREGAGASLTTPGGTKVGVDIGKGVKAEVKAGDLITVKGGVKPEGDGTVSWSAQITIGTLGDVIGPGDVAKVMRGAQDTFSGSGAALLEDHGIEGLARHGVPLKTAVSEVAEKARKSAAQGKPGWSAGVSVTGDKSGGVSGAVTFTWVF